MNEVIWATGRRKTAISRARLIADNNGTFEVNGKPFEEYFLTETVRANVIQPLVLSGKLKLVSIKARVNGGGISGQAGALAHSITRALMKFDPGTRSVLKKEGLVTRDPRMKERKKYGQPGARKRFQYSKR